MSDKLLSLSKLMEGQNPYSALLEQTRALVKKWEPTGLLEGLTDEHQIHGMSILLENQARQLIDEVSQTGGSSNSEQWAGVALPLVRRVFGEIAAKEFVSIQPMNLPSGLIFYLDFKYGSGTQPGFTQNTSLFGGSGNGKTPATVDSAIGGLYGQGRYGYSINDTVANETLAAPQAATFTTSSVSWQDVQFNSDLSASVSDGSLIKLNVSASQLNASGNIDYEGVRAMGISGPSAAALQQVYNTYTEADDQGTGTTQFVRFIISGSAAAGNYTIRMALQPLDSTRGDFEDKSESGSAATLDIPEIDIELRSEPIVAKTRKLKAAWTPELAQDLNAYHSIDAEAELTSLLSEYISMEIDLEILDMLIVNTLTTEYWSVRPGFEYDSATSGFVDLSSHTGTKNEWFQTLGNKIQRVSNRIHQLTLRGGANFIVTSPDVATVLESIPGYAADTDGDQLQFAMGVQKVGMLNSRFTVYKNPYMTQNICLVGFRGGNFLETGAVFSPYIPLIMTPLIFDPDNLKPRRGVMTRYAKKIVRPEFYGKIIISDVERV